MTLALQRRAALRRRFGVLLEGQAYALEVVTLDAEAGDEDSAVAIRARFLEQGFAPTLHRLQEALNAVCSHRLHALNTLVEPTMYVVAATWEPAGAALLWPLADIGQAALGTDAPHRVNAIVLAALPAAAPQARTRAEALSFISFAEGDALAGGDAAWGERLGLPSEAGPDGGGSGYDRLYVLDGMKANGATVSETQDLEYIIEHAASVMEALFTSPAEALLDKNLFDEIKPRTQQTYVSAGTASLVVPLAEVSTLLQDHAVGTIVLDRLLDGVADPDNSVASDLVEDTTRSIFAQARTSLLALRPRFADRGFPVAEEDRLFVNLDITHDDDIFGPQPLVLSMHTEIPLRELVAVQPAELQERLMAEIATGSDMRLAFENALESDGQSSVSAGYSRCEQTVRAILHEGDLGLIKAQRLLKGTVEMLTRRAQNLDEHREDIAASRRARSVREAVEGDRRWFYDVKRLRPIADMRPRVLAVAARCVVALVLLSQFYADSFRDGRAQWPFDVLLPRFLGSAAHDVGAATIVLAVPLILFGAFLVGLPELALRAAVLFHRRTLQAWLRLELQSDALSFLARQHHRLASLLDEHERELAGQQNELRSEARRLLRQPAYATDQLGFLERAVVRPNDLVGAAHKQHVVTRALQARGGRALESWLLDEATSGWDLKSSGEVLAEIRQSTEPSVAEFLLRPVESYIRPEDYGDYLDWAWGAAIPWAREAGGIQSYLSEAPTFGLLLVDGGSASPMADVAAMRFDVFRALDCGDPFRVQLLRLQCGIPTLGLARYAAWRLAFQLQSKTERESLTNDERLKAGFPSLVEPPPAVDDADADSTRVAEAAPNGPSEGA